MSGALLLGIVTAVALVDFLVGFVLWRKGTAAPMVGAPPEPLPEGAAAPPNYRTAGIAIMLAAPVAWAVLAALCFGLFGDVGIEPVVPGGGR